MKLLLGNKIFKKLISLLRHLQNSVKIIIFESKSAVEDSSKLINEKKEDGQKKFGEITFEFSILN